MGEDEYVNRIVRKYLLSEGIDATISVSVVSPLKQIITPWANDCLSSIDLSGSRAKGTAISLSTDIDLFVSLKPTTTTSLKDIYNSLFDHLDAEGLSCRKQNVSIGVTYQGNEIDIIPGRKQDSYGNDHSIYRRKADTWTKTNIATHISTIKNSGRRTEIAAAKIWRERHSLDFPSMYLELTMIQALEHKASNQPAKNFLTFLHFLEESFATNTIYDPANTNNRISDDLTQNEKCAIVRQAKASLAKKSWEEIIW